MRSETHELQHGVIRLAVNQHQVGLDVTVPVVFPVAGEGVVTVLLGQRLVIRQGCDDGNEIARQRLTMRAFGFAFIIAFEPAGLFNRPHSDPPSDPRRKRTTSSRHGALPSSPRWWWRSESAARTARLSRGRLGST
eukprot:TRINITY_DN44123_c0_g1_i1.p1 TRINITY_DN44123_c0_g1~~TRINITY_DN44123_c0_g1_i1.p1  ORF type:complete len:136 (+),score=4.50 TRINITY_DN44123_c0_g1_i1:270-677(+)